MKFTKTFWVPLATGLGTFAVTAGATTGIILPRALKARNALKNWVSNGGGSNSLKGKEQINYVALGDSETAGFNGVLRKDYLSYADFLAGSLKNAGKLEKYTNLAVSGERLSDFKKDIFEAPEKVREIEKADLITLTLGANDVLAYLKMFNIPFNQATNFITGGNIEVADIIKYDDNQSKYLVQKSEDITNTTDKGKVESAEAQIETLRPYHSNQDVVKRRIAKFGNNPNLGFSKEDSAELFIETVKDLSGVLTDKPEALFNIDKDWYPRIFDLIEREYVSLIRDLHEAAPDAQIRVLGHAFPFGAYPEGVVENQKESLQGDSLHDGFEKMLQAIEDGAKRNIDGESKFVKYHNINELPTFSSKIKPAIDLESAKVFEEWVTENPMPNITDIHPSVYGHDLIAEDLYKDIANEIGNIDIESTIQHSNVNPANDFWTRKDELAIKADPNDSLFNASVATYGLANMGQVISNNETIAPIIKNLVDYISKPSIDGKKETSGDILVRLLPEEIKGSLTSIIEELPPVAIGFLSNAITPIMPNYSGPTDFKDFINLIKSDETKLAEFITSILPMLPMLGAVGVSLPANIQPIIGMSGNLVNLVNDTKIITKQLQEGIQSEKVNNEEQWTVANAGLAKLFKEFRQISNKLI